MCTYNVVMCLSKKKINANSQQRKSNTNKNRILKKKKNEEAPINLEASLSGWRREKKKSQHRFFPLSLLLRF